MAEQQDYAGLHWVKEELEQTLAEASQALAKYQQEPDNPAHMSAGQSAFSQVHGTLKLLQHEGATHLSLEMNKLSEALVSERVADARMALAILIQAALQLSDYIQQLVNSGVDRPLALLPLINELRRLREEDPLPEATFFFPDTCSLIDPVEPAQLESLENAGLVPLLRKIRQKYQLTLAGYLRDQNRGQQIKILAKLFAKLQDLSWGTPLSPLWEASLALVEGLDNQSVEQNIHVANLLRELDGQIRLFIKQGASFINTHPNDAVFRGLLYYIATSEGHEGFTGALKSRYNLEEILTRAQAVISDVPTDVAEENPSALVPAAQASVTLPNRHVEVNPYDVVQFKFTASSSVAAEALTETTQSAEPEQVQTCAPEVEPDPAEQDSIIDDQWLQAFIEEAGDIQEQLTEGVATWIDHPDDQNILKNIRRAFHTLKGNARRVDASVVGELAWSVENMLNHLIDGTVHNSPELINLVSRVTRMLPGLIADFAEQIQVLTHEVLVCMEQADALSKGETYTIEDEDQGEEDPEAAQMAIVEALSKPAPESETETDVEASAEQDTFDIELLNVFLGESEAHLEVIQSFVDQVKAQGGEPPISDQLQRSLHTMKGIALMAEIAPLAEIIVALEKNIKDFRTHLIPANDQVISMLDKGLDLIQDGLQQLTLSPGQPVLDSENYLSWLEALHVQLVTGQHKAQSSHRKYPGSQDTQLFAESDLSLLLNADEYLSTWRNALSREELVLFQKELTILAERADEAGLTSLAELCSVLLDVMNYLDKHENILPGVLAAPLSNGFEAMVDMMNMVAAQQTPVPPQSVFTELRESLEALLSAESEAGGPIEEAGGPIENAPVATETVPAPSVETERAEQDVELLELFVEEATDLAEDCHHALDDWLKNRQNLATLTDLQRSLHTLKGSARMADQPELADLSHAIEAIYSVIASDSSAADKAPVHLLLAAHDQVDQMLVALREQQSPGSITPSIAPDITPIAEQLEQWILNHECAENVSPPVAAKTPAEVLPDYLGQPAPETTRLETPVHSSSVDTLHKSNEMIRIPAQLLESLITLSGESGIHRGRIEQQMHDINNTLEEMDSTIDRVKEQLRRLDTETQSQIISTFQEEYGSNPEFDPLEMDQYSELTQLSHSLVESATDLKDLKEGIQEKNREAETLLLQQSRTLIELQEKLMQARMVSFSRLLPRLNKITRQLSIELDKPVSLNVTNAEGEMDRTMLERILAPLEHLIRNAIDHGIESSVQDRLTLGKPETGHLTLAIARDGADIVVELSDDGKGINLAAVHDKALAKHLVTPDDELSDQEIAQLILEPGFSTAESVTQISGRGVGLDVVNTEIRQMGGSIQIDSEPGKGTSFKLRLPFTLSVNRALMVQVAESLYALPMQSIDGITVVSPEVLTDGYQNNASLQYGGAEHQLMYLGELLGVANPEIQPEKCPVVIIKRGGRNLALHVDEIIGGTEIFTKSLGPQFADLVGVNGATILGDGRVAIIIDPVTLVRRHRIEQHYVELNHQMDEEAEITQRVLVVDDSVTVRKVTTRLLERHGYLVESARDGVEAMTRLAESHYDILLLDIEMPKMDGYEVASAVRNDARLKSLPIIMITSRTSEKHKARAFSLGVNQYLGKPFQENAMLAAIEQLIGAKANAGLKQ